jgi:hypothetical protein
MNAYPAHLAHCLEPRMTLCPIAIAIGCKKCPIFAVCPVKTIIGDYKPEEHAKGTLQHSKAKGGAKKSR